MCCQVHALYALLEEYKIKVPDVDKAGYASLDSTYAGLKALMEEVEGAKEESVAKYSSGLETGKHTNRYMYHCCFITSGPQPLKQFVCQTCRLRHVFSTLASRQLQDGMHMAVLIICCRY